MDNHMIRVCVPFLRIHRGQKTSSVVLAATRTTCNKQEQHLRPYSCGKQDFTLSHEEEGSQPFTGLRAERAAF